MKTFMAKESEVEKKWYTIDAEGKPLGRLATEIAGILRGKHKPEFTPHIDSGDYVIVINCEKVVLTGKKAKQKIYYKHTLYPGGLKQTPYEKLLETKPEKAILLAVKRMLPQNALGRRMFKKLKVYKGTDHPHTAQKPEKWEIKQ